MSELCVREYGDNGAPTVVCLHGVTSWGGHFESLAERLASSRWTLAMDSSTGRFAPTPEWS